VHQAENVVENLGVVWILLEFDELDVNQVEAFVGLGQEFSKKIVHENWPLQMKVCTESTAFWYWTSLSGKPLFLVERT
jgi:hypothetical protein